MIGSSVGQQPETEGAVTVLCGTTARHCGKAAPVRGPVTACLALVIQPCVIPPISGPVTQLTSCQREGE